MTTATINSTPTLLQQQAEWLEEYQLGIRISEQGNILSVGDGIAWISGLPSAWMTLFCSTMAAVEWSLIYLQTMSVWYY